VSTTSGTLSRAPRPSSLADVLDLILDKGLVIDAYVRVSLVGIEILTIDARIVVASVDTYLHFAEAVNRLDLPSTETQGLTELFGGQGDEEGEGAQEDEAGGRGGDGAGRHQRDRDDQGQREVTGGRGEAATGEDQEAQQDQEGHQDQEGQGSRGEREPSLAQRLVERGRWES